MILINNSCLKIFEELYNCISFKEIYIKKETIEGIQNILFI